MSKAKITESGELSTTIYMRGWREKNRDRYNKGQKKWAEENKEKRKLQARKSHLKKKFGISLEQFENLVSSQDGKCKICKITPKEVLYVDHDHISGKIRGLLCRNCNFALGHLKDNIEFVRKAIEYLDNTE